VGEDCLGQEKARTKAGKNGQEEGRGEEKWTAKLILVADLLDQRTEAYWLLHVPPVVLVKPTLKSRFPVVRLIILPKILGSSLKVLGALLVMVGRHRSAIFFSLVSGSFTFSFIVHGCRPIACECMRRDKCQQDGERKSNHMNSYKTPLNQ